jgi:hypothetical protein
MHLLYNNDFPVCMSIPLSSSSDALERLYKVSPYATLQKQKKRTAEGNRCFKTL